jgi:hypothetical protein
MKALIRIKIRILVQPFLYFFITILEMLSVFALIRKVLLRLSALVFSLGKGLYYFLRAHWELSLISSVRLTKLARLQK